MIYAHDSYGNNILLKTFILYANALKIGIGLLYTLLLK